MTCCALCGMFQALRLRAVGALALALLIAGASCTPAPGTSATPPPGSAMPQSIIDPYLKIQGALAHDSTEGVRANAGAIATAATALGAPAMKIDMAAVQLAAAGDLADTRAKFGTLSDALVTYVNGERLTLPNGVRTAMCPMVHKPWLQAGGILANPYFGSEMPMCGEFTSP